MNTKHRTLLAIIFSSSAFAASGCVGFEVDAEGDSLEFVETTEQALTAGLGLRWSSSGPIAGMVCTQINELSDPHTWHDNYLCSPTNLGLRWSPAGKIGGMVCTHISEPSDPHTWHDNYLCSPTNLGLSWSSIGAIPGKTCVNWTEPSDPHTWHDNYLCSDPSGGGGLGTVVRPRWKEDIRGPGAKSQYYWSNNGNEPIKTDDPSGGAIERSELASDYYWKANSGWHGFSARFKVKRGGGSIAQVMNCLPGQCYPQLMVLYGRENNGTLTQAHHTNGGIIATNVGTDFVLKIRDNGNKNEVYVNGVLMRQGPHQRLEGNNNFKYGMYHGKAQYQSLASGALVEVSDVVVTEE